MVASATSSYESEDVYALAGSSLNTVLAVTIPLVSLSWLYRQHQKALNSYIFRFGNGSFTHWKNRTESVIVHSIKFYGVDSILRHRISTVPDLRLRMHLQHNLSFLTLPWPYFQVRRGRPTCFPLYIEIAKGK